MTLRCGRHQRYIEVVDCNRVCGAIVDWGLLGFLDEEREGYYRERSTASGYEVIRCTQIWAAHHACVHTSRPDPRVQI
jgi:hypothetical protein